MSITGLGFLLFGWTVLTWQFWVISCPLCALSGWFSSAFSDWLFK